MADLKAALAANINGRDALLQLVQTHGLEMVGKYMDHLRKHAAKKMRDTLMGISDGLYESWERLDDGTQLKARIYISGGHCEIDFSGSDPVHSGNMNATLAIVHGVVIYVMRLLINESLPLNDGIMEPLKLVVPEGLLNPDFSGPPEACPAIVGGNVEVSQRLTDTLLKPLNILACSQGTMNNVLFGNDRFSYYETLCGGCGASKEGHGASAVHHHMTNTRITDPEILEFRYPVRLEVFEIRQGSGGQGKFNGGNGITRVFHFLDDMALSVLTQHRVEQPYGMNGGMPGASGSQYIIKQNGSRIGLKSVDGVNISKGDLFYIHTPGGGGWGKPT
jgi:5-oxoprolinase (ATP-hydrolysing)